MSRYFRSFMTIILLLAIGMVLPVEGYAGGSFEVPQVEGDFGQYDPAPGQAEPIESPSPDVQEEGGLWDRLTESASSAWEWSKEKVSVAWNWTKDTASAFWDEILDIIAKIAEVVVDALAAVWDWILEHKGITVVILSILGVIAVAVGLVAGISVVAFAGIAILAGELISGLFSGLAGNELFGDEMLLDILIGGIAGGIAALFGWAVGAGTAGSSLVVRIGSKIPWLGRAFPKMVGGGAAGGAEQSVTDLLKEGKINWKKTIIATGLGFVLVFGGETIGSHSDDIIKKINNVNISYVTEVFSDGTASAPKTIGDTGFGQWLQRLVSKGGGVGKTKSIKSLSIADSFQHRIDMIRSKMPNRKLRLEGNMAIADVNIKGIKSEFVAHSRINNPTDKGADVAEFSYLKPEEKRLFKTYQVDKYPRYHDTEAKIIEDIVSQIKDPSIKGEINLYTELPACQSCTNIIFEFRRHFPNIKLNIYSGE